MTSFNLPGIPGELQWQNLPVDWSIGEGNQLAVTAGDSTDWFIDPAGTSSKDNAPSALFVPPDENFLLSAKVMVDFASAFDAGALQLRVQDDLWAKLCFEYSPQRQPMVVSVVTRGVSDDCNSAVIDAEELYLRIAKTTRTVSFHYSRDGAYWHLVRYFTLGKLDTLRAGFSSQSPTGQTCRVVFTDIRYRSGRLNDNRSGQ